MYNTTLDSIDTFKLTTTKTNYILKKTNFLVNIFQLSASNSVVIDECRIDASNMEPEFKGDVVIKNSYLRWSILTIVLDQQNC